jgi:hypothetical protein
VELKVCLLIREVTLLVRLFLLTTRFDGGCVRVRYSSSSFSPQVMVRRKKMMMAKIPT